MSMRAHRQPAPLRPRPAGHPRRSELAGARLPRRGRHAGLLPRGPGRLAHRRRRQPLRGLRRIVGAAHPRPRPSRPSSRPSSPRRHVGTSFGAPHAGEVELAELICQRLPAVEKVRLVSSGHRGDARGVRARARLHRARRAREVRGLLPRRGRRLSGEGGLAASRRWGCRTRRACRRRSPGSPSPRPSTTSAAARALFSPAGQGHRRGHHRAGRRQHGRARPPGRLPRRALASCASAHGALLIFDEVMTGLPARAGRRAGAVRRSRPTSPRMGKVIGGGLPVGAYGGRRDIMRRSPRRGPCTRRARSPGTRSRSPRGLACLKELGEPGIYDRLESISPGAHRRAGRRGARRRRSGDAEPGRQHVDRSSSPTEPVFDYPSAKRADTAKLRQLLPRAARPGRVPAAVASSRPPSSRWPWASARSSTPWPPPGTRSGAL